MDMEEINTSTRTNTSEPIALNVPLSTSLALEITYQLLFFMIGTPLNIRAIRRTSRNLREGGVESRLVKLSRQLMIAHIIVLFVYGFWRSFWLYGFFWTQGDFLCRVFSFLQALPFHLWSNIVAAIAVDMLCCIRSPLSSYRTGATRVKYFIIISWVGAILCSLPMVALRGTIELSRENLQGIVLHDLHPAADYSGHYQCYPLDNIFEQDLLVGNGIFHTATSFYIPLVVIVLCYSAIGISLHKQMSARRLISDGEYVNIRTSATKTRFLKATIAIVCTYVLTWLPYQALHLVRLLCPADSKCSVVTERFEFLQSIIIASTCINPFLYNFGSERPTARHSGNGSTFEHTQRSTMVVANQHNNKLSAEIMPCLGQTTSIGNLSIL